MSKTNIWMSVSDLMTGLMVIFLFIAISYIIRVDENQTVLKDYVDTKQQLYEALVTEFDKDKEKWDMSIGRDLTMKFQNAQVQFESGSHALAPQFKTILDDFLPRYFAILLKSDLKDRIQEIRIEGHTDNDPIVSGHYNSNPFLGNVQLSQERAYSVLNYFYHMDSYNNYSKQEKEQLQYWLTANGLSFGRSLDNEGNLTFESKKRIDKKRSRRVEFRIVTNGDELLEEFVKQLEK